MKVKRVALETRTGQGDVGEGRGPAGGVGVGGGEGRLASLRDKKSEIGGDLQPLHLSLSTGHWPINRLRVASLIATIT